MRISWDASSRIAAVQGAPGATLTADDGAVLVDALARWVGEDLRPFGVLADVKGVRATDAGYRVRTRAFFARERERAYVAVVNAGPVIRVIAEMFRVGTGINLKGFASEAGARAWLRRKGLHA